MTANNHFPDVITQRTDEEKPVIVPSFAKLCVNCTHRVFDVYNNTWTCSVFVNAVTGNPVPCSIVRGDVQYCGKTGEEYDPK